MGSAASQAEHLITKPEDRIPIFQKIIYSIGAFANTAQAAFIGQMVIVLNLGLGVNPVLMDSQAKYGLLAAGNGELIFRLLSPSQPGYQEKIWDQAAGSILVEEAGGTVTDLKGARLDFAQGRTLRNNLGVLASNGHLHDRALSAVMLVGADRRPEDG